ncbi:MAG: hypothetical protein WKF77_08240 [Planctomycetaceae bacterium]
MDRMFPFGFESHLSFYLVIYVLTLVSHFFLMTYVLAGSAWLAWATLFPGYGLLPRTKQPLAMILRDWMPFALSGAITAGVAPLLFVQILYRQQFYTANLLLGWRWMMVIPALVIAFYLLYVIKSKAVSHWSFPLRCGLAVGIAASFLFVAFCWTTNHLLSLDEATWPEMYRSRRAVATIGPLCLRLLTWVAGSFPIMSILAGWQLWGMRRLDAKRDLPLPVPNWMAFYSVDERRLAWASVGGLAIAVVSGVSYATTLNSEVSSQLTGSAGLPWLLVVVTCVSFQAIGWLLQLRKLCFCPRWLTAITLASLGTLIATASLREIIRLARADLTQVAESTRAAAEVGGFAVFLIFTIINTVLIGWCIRIVMNRSANTKK